MSFLFGVVEMAPFPASLGYSATPLNEEAVWICCLPEWRGLSLCVAMGGSTHVLPSSPARLFL